MVAADLPLLTASDPRAVLSQAAARRDIATASGRPVRFVEDGDAPAEVAYESHIATSGRVPTRLNRHDLLNALVWLAFPSTKARLNALQAEAIAHAGIGPRRGALRDAATVFDENGALLITEDPVLPALLRAHDWHEAFVVRRQSWERARVVCFGHALIDRLAQPYKALTAHMLVVGLASDTSLERVDSAVARSIDARLSMSALSPLPVLGIPGWWPANEDPAFYDDRSIFRPARRAPESPRDPRDGRVTMRT